VSLNDGLILFCSFYAKRINAYNSIHFRWIYANNYAPRGVGGKNAGHRHAKNASTPSASKTKTARKGGFS
jgi:hypothetical protein